MGTRGAWGFVNNDIERITYNHFDSYPGGLGLDLLAWARAQDWNKVRERVMDLHLVAEDAAPTAEEREQVAAYTDSGVSTGADWYAALRHCQGDPEKTLESGFMIDSTAFPLDSLFCEYAYVFDLDDGTFEVYKGFQTTTPTTGRWAGRAESESSEYKAVALWEVWPLHDLPTQEQFTERLIGDPE